MIVLGNVFQPSDKKRRSIYEDSDQNPSALCSDLKCAFVPGFGSFWLSDSHLGIILAFQIAESGCKSGISDFSNADNYLNERIHYCGLL